MFKSRSWVAVAAAGLTLSACASSSNLVLEPNRSGYKAQSVTLQYNGGTVNVEEESVAELKRYMQDEFFGKEGAFQQGQQLTVKYGFMSFDEGSQAARYFLGPIGGGEATMVVGAEFYDANGKLLAKIQSEGRLSGGFFGGDAGSAIEGAAKEIAAYAETNFGQ